MLWPFFFSLYLSLTFPHFSLLFSDELFYGMGNMSYVKMRHVIGGMDIK